MPANDLSTSPPNIGTARCCGLCRHFSIETWARGRCALLNNLYTLFGWVCDHFEAPATPPYSIYRRMVPPPQEALPYKIWDKRYRETRKLRKTAIISQIVNARLESGGLPSSTTPISLEYKDIIVEKALALGLPTQGLSDTVGSSSNFYRLAQVHYSIVCRYRDDAKVLAAEQLREWRKEYIRQDPPPPRLTHFTQPELPDPMRRFLTEEAEEQHDKD